MLRYLALILTVAGLAAALWLVGASGWAEVLRAIETVGVGGFVLLIAWQFFVFGVLGFAWWLIAPEMSPRRILTFTWARTTRDASSEILPFSQIGGLVVGARTAVAGGLRSPLVYASLIADQTTELGGQLLYALFGLLGLVLALEGQSAAVLPLALGGAGVMAALLCALAFAQRPMIGIAKALAGHLLPASLATFDALADELDAIYRRRAQVAYAFLIHAVGWAFSGAAGWIALWLMGRPLPLLSVLTIEALIFGLRTVAFAVPGGFGVQEAAYALLGPIFGLSPATALALSIVKRARDVAFGVPVVLIWQWREWRALRSAGDES